MRQSLNVESRHWPSRRGRDCEIEVGDPLPHGGDLVVAILDHGREEPFVVHTRDGGLSQVTEELLIGEVARRAGIRPSAIRYYESIGLQAEPARIAGRRRYTVEIVRTLSIIGAAQRAGLTLGDVRELLAASDANGGVSESCVP